MSKNKPVVTFPHMGKYHIAFKTLCELLDCEIMTPPPITKKTIELGSKYSPEFVCVPFKYNLGNYLESLERGANLIIQAGGGCRFGYYSEVQEEILKDLGYDFQLLHLDNSLLFIRYYWNLKEINPKLTMIRFLAQFFKAFLKTRSIDAVEDYIRKNIGFEVNEGDFEKLEKRYYTDLDRAKSIIQILKVKNKYLREFKKIKVDKSRVTLRVGVVGELYVLMEPFSNYFIEKQLAKRGIEVHRFINLTYLMFGKGLPGHKKHLLELAHPYLKYTIGADGTDSVAMANKLRKEGFDGLIHLKPFGCMPEVNAMAALQKLAKENNFPVIYFSFDSQTSETGIKTRLEAFYDMLMMRKKSKVK